MNGFIIRILVSGIIVRSLLYTTGVILKNPARIRYENENSCKATTEMNTEITLE